ncbi:MAG: GNAT family N-acetyltransferase [Mycobacteriales bacterium]
MTDDLSGVRIRAARPEEYAAVGELTVVAYVAGGHGGTAYAERLRDAAGRAAAGELLVATGSIIVTSAAEKSRNRGMELTTIDVLEDRRGISERLLGTVALFPAGAEYAQLAGAGEIEIRMLAVDPAVRGRGVGAALAAGCVQRGMATGASAIRLSTEPSMTAAHRIYERLGFRRTPDRDWSPVPGATLLTYALDLHVAAAYCDRCGEPLAPGTHAECERLRRPEPPRYCVRCRRRLVVQVTPRGWTARCSRHGDRSAGRADSA